MFDSIDPQYVGTGTDEMQKHELKTTSPVLYAGENKTRMGWTRPPDSQPVDQPIVMVSSLFYTHSDHLGSSSVTVDSQGNIKQLLSYHPYGTTHFQKDTSDYQNDKKFTGKELDEEVGWYYYGARYYMPEAGRWTSVDPIVLGNVSNLQTQNQAEYIKRIEDESKNLFADPQKSNLYTYSRNNPIVYIDFKGQWAEKVMEWVAEEWSSYLAWRNENINIEEKKWVERYTIAKAQGYSFGANSVEEYKAIHEEMMGWVLGSIGEGLKIGANLGKLGTVVEATPGKITSFLRSIDEQINSHGLDRIIERGVTPEMIKNATQKPLIKLQQAGENFLYLTKEAAVVLDKVGQVVTAYGANQFKEAIKEILSKF